MFHTKMSHAVRTEKAPFNYLLGCFRLKTQQLSLVHTLIMSGPR